LVDVPARGRGGGVANKRFINGIIRQSWTKFKRRVQAKSLRGRGAIIVPTIIILKHSSNRGPLRTLWP